MLTVLLVEWERTLHSVTRLRLAPQTQRFVYVVSNTITPAVPAALLLTFCCEKVYRFTLFVHYMPSKMLLSLYLGALDVLL